MNNMKRVRLLWGVTFVGGSVHPEGNAPTLLGDGWLTVLPQPHYDGEPTRTLVFLTRAQARAWCATQYAKYRGREDWCGRWRFRTVRVRETVEVVEGRGRR